jgi:hypothetical protein
MNPKLQAGQVSKTSYWEEQLFLKREEATPRFLNKVQVNGPDECWLWHGSKLRSYGAFWMADQVLVRAHRAAWIINRGRIPIGTIIMHRCDNRLCVNVNHLSTGTCADNSNDMVSKHRQARGVGHANARLTEDLVRKIRALNKSGVGGTEIARQIGVGASTVRNVLYGNNWGWVA